MKDSGLKNKKLYNPKKLSVDKLPLESSSSILEPGLWQLDPEQERYRVPACGVIVVELYPDDILVVKDPEGGQIAEVVPFSDEGKGDPGILGIKK